MYVNYWDVYWVGFARKCVIWYTHCIGVYKMKRSFGRRINNPFYLLKLAMPAWKPC